MSSGVGGRSRIAVPLLTAVALLLPPSAGAQPQSSVQVEMSEFAFQPATIDLSAGRPIRLVLINHGQIAHQFETEYLRALAVRIASGTVYAEAAGLDVIRLDPGGTARLEFVPRRRGRFVFACTIEGHREAGMKGILEVR